MRTRILGAVVWLGAIVLPAPGVARGADGGRAKLAVVAKERVMTGNYKVYAAAREFPDQWLAAAVVQNEGTGPLDDVRARFQLVGQTDWSAWSPGARCAPGDKVAIPYHPVLDRRVAELQSSTPVELKVEWKCRGDGGPGEGAATKTITFLGGREFVFSDLIDGGGSFEETFSNARFLAAWVSRDDPVIKQFAALASRNAGGVAAIQSIEHGVETLRASYELMLLNDFVYKSSVTLADSTVSFDNKSVQNVKYPRDVLRDKSGTCVELAILHAAIAHQLGIRAKLAIVPGHCFPIFELSEGRGDERKVRRVPLESTGIRGGIGGQGSSRIGFRSAVERAERNEKRSREGLTFIEVDVSGEWGRGVASPELPPLPDDSLERWGITGKGLPGITLPGVGAGDAKTDASGFGGVWEGPVKARFGGTDMRPHRATIAIEVLRGNRYKLRATFVPEGGGPTVQEESVAEDQEGQLVFQGTSRSRALAAGASEEITPGRGTATVKDGKLVGKYGADGEGFSSFALVRR